MLIICSFLDLLSLIFSSSSSDLKNHYLNLFNTYKFTTKDTQNLKEYLFMARMLSTGGDFTKQEREIITLKCNDNFLIKSNTQVLTNLGFTKHGIFNN